MNIEYRVWKGSAKGWEPLGPSRAGSTAQLVVVMGDRLELEKQLLHASVAALYPDAHVVFLSTGGEIYAGTGPVDGILLTALAFERTTVAAVGGKLKVRGECHAVASELLERLPKEGLRHVLVLSDGRMANGSELVRGLLEVELNGALISGGMAADGMRFERTLVGLDGEPEPGGIAIVGFYGEHLDVRCGAEGGFRSFGPERLVTRSEGNVVHEFDGERALDLFRRYLGDAAKDLPGSGLRYPLSIQAPGATHAIVRTVLGMDEDKGSMTFAGTVPEGSRAQFMYGSYEALVDGAGVAAERIEGEEPPDFVFCISCIGRRMILGQRAEDEFEAIRVQIGDAPAMIGYYSYGEITGGDEFTPCYLQNQTMCLTAFRER